MVAFRGIFRRLHGQGHRLDHAERLRDASRWRVAGNGLVAPSPCRSGKRDAFPDPPEPKAVERNIFRRQRDTELFNSPNWTFSAPSSPRKAGFRARPVRRAPIFQPWWMARHPLLDGLQPYEQLPGKLCPAKFSIGSKPSLKPAASAPPKASTSLPASATSVDRAARARPRAKSPAPKIHPVSRGTAPMRRAADRATNG